MKRRKTFDIKKKKRRKVDHFFFNFQPAPKRWYWGDFQQLQNNTIRTVNTSIISKQNLYRSKRNALPSIMSTELRKFLIKLRKYAFRIIELLMAFLVITYCVYTNIHNIV